mmetsp:Transcript_15608/g.42587  ORF Transcript_15608/g.42587 Transcript_15608/m.42587 type:complete len:321 (-) Transcript_15608:482-1444(-)
MITEQRALPSSERVPRHRYRNGHVDAHHAHLNLTSECACHATIRGETRDAVTELVFVDQFDGSREVGHSHDAQHWSEDLLAVDLHLGPHVVEQRAAKEKAFLAASNLALASVHHQRGARCHAVFDIANHFSTMLRGDQGSHLGFLGHAVHYLQRLDLRNQPIDQRIGVAHHHGHRDRHAAFASRAIRRTHQCAGHLGQIGVRHHHHVVLGASQRLCTLAACRTLRVDVLRDRRRPDERQGLHVGMLDQGIDGFLVAVDNVEHAIGQAGLLQQFCQAKGDGRVSLGGLEHECVATCDRHWKHPARNHHREIERRDPCNNAQ